jgi:hypothetical protein
MIGSVTHSVFVFAVRQDADKYFNRGAPRAERQRMAAAVIAGRPKADEALQKVAGITDIAALPIRNSAHPSAGLL